MFIYSNRKNSPCYQKLTLARGLMRCYRCKETSNSLSSKQNTKSSQACSVFSDTFFYLFNPIYLLSGVGNLFTFAGRMNCGMSPPGRKKSLIPFQNSTFIIQRKTKRENHVKEWRTSLDLLCMCLLVMEFRFDAMLCSNLGHKNSDAGHIECSRGPQVPHPCAVWKVAVE